MAKTFLGAGDRAVNKETAGACTLQKGTEWDKSLFTATSGCYSLEQKWGTETSKAGKEEQPIQGHVIKQLTLWVDVSGSLLAPSKESCRTHLRITHLNIRRGGIYALAPAPHWPRVVPWGVNCLALSGLFVYQNGWGTVSLLQRYPGRKARGIQGSWGERLVTSTTAGMKS